MSPASHSSMSEDTKGLRDVPVPSTSSISDAPKVTEVKDLELGLDRPSLKRKEVESSGNRFKIVSQLVIAMKRFQASLNPTYTYGKRPTPSSSSSGAVSSRSFRRSDTPTDASEVTSVARQNSRGGERGAPKVPRPWVQHGHKTDYIFSALPPHPDEAGRRPPMPKSASGRSISAGAT